MRPGPVPAPCPRRICFSASARLAARRLLRAGLAAAAVAACGQPAGRPAAPGPPRFPCAPAATAACWARDPLHRAYGMAAVSAHGITGAGTTIAVIAPYLNPWLARDLGVYSAWYRLPAPQLEVIDADHAPAADPRSAGQAGWAEEGTADLELAHFMAPRARLIYLAIPGTGPRLEAEALAALAWLAAHTQVDVVTFSWGIHEPAFTGPGGPARLGVLRRGLTAAARAGVTVVCGTGDTGPAMPGPGGSLSRVRAVAWPAADPLVTAVGSALLHTSGVGARVRPDTVSGGDGDGHATGAGLSVLYARPWWQDPAAAVTGSHRGVADVSMALRAQIYTHLAPLTGSRPGWNDAAGTSISAPLFAGLAADAAQLAGHRLGVLGPALYRMRGTADGVLDITSGTNTVPGVPGYAASPGYDLASGIGTVGSAWPFINALARLSQQHATGGEPR